MREDKELKIKNIIMRQLTPLYERHGFSDEVAKSLATNLTQEMFYEIQKEIK